MNKVLHVLVYVFLVLAGAALFFELQLNDKRAELTDRNRLQEDCFVKLARTIEKAEPDKAAAFEIKKDVSPVEAKVVDAEMENVLEEYPAALEQANLETYNFDASRQQLRSVYVLDENGKPVMDGNEPLMRGPGTEQEILDKLFESAKAQQTRLNTTRQALANLRGKLEETVAEINKLKPDARQDKVTIEEQKEKVAKLEEEKTGLENQLTKVKSQIGELNSEITSLKDEVATAKDDAEAEKEKVAQKDKLIEKLNGLLKQSIQTQSTQSIGSGVAVAKTAAGEKGKIIDVDNATMYAVVKFTDEAFKELKGENGNQPIPLIEFGIKRDNKFVGRLRLRQEVKGKPIVICDLLSAWEQDKAQKNDVVFAD